MQQWYSFSDPAMEEELCEIPFLRQFAGLSLSRCSTPDETSILKFRHLLEQHDLTGKVLDAVTDHLHERGD